VDCVIPSKIGLITLLQEVNRLLTGLNCGKVLETIALPESATALSVKHGFDIQVSIRFTFSQKILQDERYAALIWLYFFLQMVECMLDSLFFNKL
jgi:hypothetical protein